MPSFIAASTLSALAPSRTQNAASFIMLKTILPESGMDSVSIIALNIFSNAVLAVLVVFGAVDLLLTISSTLEEKGIIKWMPISRSGVFIAFASTSIGIEDEQVAITASGLAIFSKSPRTSFLTFSFSPAASIIMSASLWT